MVLLNPIPLIIIDSIDRLKKGYGLTLYKHTVYQVNYSDKIICFIEKQPPEKNSLIFTMLWKNEYDVNVELFKSFQKEMASIITKHNNIYLEENHQDADISKPKTPKMR